MSTVTGKAQDKALLDALEEYMKDALMAGDLTENLVAGVTRVHERNISVAFPDGRVVSLVLYGPRGK